MLFERTDISAAVDGGPWRVGASFARRILSDALSSRCAYQDRDAHLGSAVAWLKRAAAATTDGGVSYGYSIRGGWRPSYRETSGYIAVTFFDLERELGDLGSGRLARSVSAWLCEVQEADGSIANPRYGAKQGIVFDTGQVLFGYARAYRETGDARFRDCASRAGAWLAARLNEDGAWTKNTHLGHAHTYNTRVAWAMLESNEINPDPEVETAARKNLDWALRQQTGGYFRNCAFELDVAPFTHTIAYAIRGLLESGRLTAESRYTEAAVRAADAIARHVRDDGWIPGQIDVDGRAAAHYCCLTGNCQLAIIWLKLYQSTGSLGYLDAAKRALGFVMKHQDLTTSNLDLRGAIKGSQPIWGRYAPLSYPNWAAKFFIDAMLLWKRIEP